MEKKKETVAQKALRLLSPIPKADFITGSFTDERGKCCVIGHFARLTSENPNSYSFSNCSDDHFGELRTASERFFEHKKGEDGSLVKANNFPFNGYKQKTIKGRVIACLKDMVKAGY